ncbi:hypothetical protein Tco_1353917, partial [Tanacetum coccineum]
MTSDIDSCCVALEIKRVVECERRSPQQPPRAIKCYEIVEAIDFDTGFASFVLGDNSILSSMSPISSLLLLMVCDDDRFVILADNELTYVICHLGYSLLDATDLSVAAIYGVSRCWSVCDDEQFRWVPYTKNGNTNQATGRDDYNIKVLVYPDFQYVGSSSIELEGIYSACIPVGKGQPHIFHVKLDQGGPAAPLLARDTKTELGGFTYVNEVVKIR